MLLRIAGFLSVANNLRVNPRGTVICHTWNAVQPASSSEAGEHSEGSQRDPETDGSYILCQMELICAQTESRQDVHTFTVTQSAPRSVFTECSKSFPKVQKATGSNIKERGKL